MRLDSDGAGNWTRDGEPQPHLEGAPDVDLGFTPATNTLPIRRLDLAVGESGRVRSAWLRFPELRLEPLDQTYTREAERVYRYLAQVDGEPFTARLDTDELGRVLRYEGLWEAEPAPPAKVAKRPTASASYEELYVPDRAGWRRWLTRNHRRAPGIWLVFDKAAHREDRLPYADAVEEALCFGWIDSTVRPLNEGQYRQLFTPRKARSTWSRVNKERVERLAAAGRMHAAGLEAIARAKGNGSWESLDAVESLTMPPELEAALAGTKGAAAAFAVLSPSARKGYLHWVAQAKRPETRAMRVAEVVRLALAGKRSRFD
jgi:uncharacterized protein YdeI (YjbR/CyaY-like superfamily)